MVGELAMDRFRLIERLGSGGMGTVYRALDERLQREVAVKEIDGADAGRVLREAKAAARLNHPCIATLYEFGAQGRCALLISELARGEPLDILAAEGAMTDREVAWVGADVCSALAHAHARGVVHRDVKPQNIMVDLAAVPVRAKLMDFGIASIAGEASLTAPGEVLGTLAYMAPEQAEGEGAAEASDVYSLALTLYECWAGRNPVAAGTPAATARRIGTELPSLASARPDLPKDLVAVIDDALRADHADRPTVDDLAEVLEEAGPDLDDEHCVPGRAEPDEPRWEWRPARGGLLAMATLTVSLAALAGPAGLPGLALVLSVLTLPAALFASSLPLAALAVLAAPLGAVSLATAAPATVAHAWRGSERAALGALGWLWVAAASLALGAGPALPFADRAASGWTHSASAAATGVLAPLLDPVSIAAAAAFALAAWSIGVLARAAHVSLALLGALLWGAAFDGILRLLGLGALSPSPLAAAGAGIAAVLIVAGAAPAVRAQALAPALPGTSTPR